MAWFLNDFNMLEILMSKLSGINRKNNLQGSNKMQLSKFEDNISGPIIEAAFIAESDKPSMTGKTILLIDDEPLVTDICEMMLKKLGHKVLKAHSGSEGIKLFEANRNRIDLIISDFNMPGMDGQEVVDKLRIMDHSVKVLLSSGGLSVVGEEEAIFRGFNGFLKKPYGVNTLSDKIAEILN